MITLPSDIELVQYAASTYKRDDVFCDVLGSSLVLFKDVRPDGLIVISNEGTHNPPGWAFDFLALEADSRHGFVHPDLGWVHAGFFGLCVMAYPKVLEAVRDKPYAIDGHSLGAIAALMLGAMLTVAGQPPAKVGAFAPPRGGGAQFVRIATSGPFCAYQYGQDPVPDVPFTIEPLFPYQQVPLTLLPAPRVDPFDLQARVAMHHIENYVAGVSTKDAAAASAGP